MIKDIGKHEHDKERNRIYLKYQMKLLEIKNTSKKLTLHKINSKTLQKKTELTAIETIQN